MEYISVTGGLPLAGEIPVSGAKNSVLPLLASTILFRGECVIHHCPRLTDVDAALEILENLGCKIGRYGDTVTVDSSGLCENEIKREAMSRMRSSILFLGSLLARTGRCGLHEPGGCCLGERPIDLHLRGMECLGAEVFWNEGRLTCCGKLKGGTCILPFPSVGATENLIMAALGASAPTTICNAAREPEIGDLIGFLTAGGAKISGRGTGTLMIEPGFPYGIEYTVMPDRVEAATYLAATAATGGAVLLTGISPGFLTPVLTRYVAAGCTLKAEDGRIWLKAPERLRSAGVIRTEPYPGFPTDAQAPVMASLLRAEGVTVFEENVFSDRYRHVPALRAMGADIVTTSSVAVVTGVETTRGTDMEATDLRGGAAMVVAALAGEGESRIFGLHHLRRGYTDMTGRLHALGAKIKEVNDEPAGNCQEGSYHEQGSTAVTSRNVRTNRTGETSPQTERACGQHLCPE